MRYLVILFLLFIVSGCVSRQTVSIDPGAVQAIPESKALEVLHEQQPPERVELYPGYEFCLFSLSDVKSMKTGELLQYQDLALVAKREWFYLGIEHWYIEIVRADSGKVLCRYNPAVEKRNSQGRAAALKVVSRIATAWVAMGGKIADD